MRCRGRTTSWAGVVLNFTDLVSPVADSALCHQEGDQLPHERGPLFCMPNGLIRYLVHCTFRGCKHSEGLYLSASDSTLAVLRETWSTLALPNTVEMPTTSVAGSASACRIPALYHLRTAR